MASKIPGSECIKFVSLRELLGFDMDESILPGLLSVNHPIATKISLVDERSRAILAATCQTSSENLRKSFENPNSGELRLYRGLSKFMLQDLAMHPNMMTLSKTKRKKLATQVAFEMVVVCYTGVLMISLDLQDLPSTNLSSRFANTLCLK